MPDGARAAPERRRESDPLVIRGVEFLGGMASVAGWRPETTLPEIAFAGRSNSGKSSLINALVRRRKIARVSNTPGRTREINFFRVNDRFVLVDLPGYGFARISKAQRATWRPMIEHYVRQNANLRGIVQLLDVRHDPTPEDMAMLDFLADVGVPTIVAATKTDKLSRRDEPSRLAALAQAAHLDPEQIIPFSARTGAGRNELAAAMMALIEEPVVPGS